MTSCPMCSSPVEQRPTGRPRTYCSTGCRRTADNEVSRLTRRLDVIESRLDELYVLDATIDVGWGGNPKGLSAKLRAMGLEQERLTARRVELTERLRQLLAGEGPTTSARTLRPTGGSRAPGRGGRSAAASPGQDDSASVPARPARSPLVRSEGGGEPRPAAVSLEQAPHGDQR